MANKVLLIGLDGASFDLLMPWIREGKLPVFKKLLDNGISGELKSTIPALTCPALPTIYTGMNPGNTGIFSFRNPDGSVISSSQIDYKTIWQILTEKNKKSLISNLRTTYPPEEINGVMICSLHAGAKPSEIDSWEKTELSWVYPRSLQKELCGWTIDHKRFLTEIRDKILKDDPEGYKIVRDLTKFRATKFKEILLGDDYDFAFHWIEHTDTLCHLKWNDKEEILRFYREVIEPILSDFIKTFSDWNILIISDHGSAEGETQELSINTWLKNKGYLVTKGRFQEKLYAGLLHLAKKITPGFIINEFILGKINDSTTDKKEGHGRKIVLQDNRFIMRWVDWSQTIAYSDSGWGIRLNKQNIKNYELIRNKIIGELAGLLDEKQEKILQGAWMREDIYHGKYIEQIPDIIILPKNNFHSTTLPKKNVLSEITRKTPIGNHNFARNALLIAVGPDVRKNQRIMPPNLYDIMPTVLHLLGLKIPRDLDGRVITELIGRNSGYHKKKIEYTNESIKRTHEIRGLTDSEEIEIKKRLRTLGYI